MAYRKVGGGGGGGGGEPQAPSFLDEFLDQIETLPAQIKSKFAEMRDLDDQAARNMDEAEAASADAVRKSASLKSTGGNDPLKKSFVDVLSFQGKAIDASLGKVAIAENSYEIIEQTIKGLDDRLRDYEAQLKKEGRWPADEKKSEKIAARKAGFGPGMVAAEKKDAGGPIRRDLVKKEPVPGVAVVNTKNRRRDKEKAEKLARQALKAKKDVAAAERAAGLTANPGGTAALVPGVAGMIVIDDAAIDPNEEVFCHVCFELVVDESCFLLSYLHQIF